MRGRVWSSLIPRPSPLTSYKKRPPGFRQAACAYSTSLRSEDLVGRVHACGSPHTFSDNPNLLDAGALGRVNHRHDFAVPQRPRGRDEHRLLLALLEDVAEAGFQLGHADRLLVH